MKLESYQYNLFDRLWLKLEARSADSNTERIAMLMPVVLYMEKDRLESLLDALPKILQNYLKPHLVQRISSQIILKLQEYKKNEQIFMQERNKALDSLAQNIQLYGLVLDVFEGEEDSPNLAIIEQIVRKKFDKDYQLNRTNLRLLTYQERHCAEPPQKRNTQKTSR